jgi:hypothetical protein
MTLLERIAAALEANRELVRRNCNYPCPTDLGKAALALLPECAEEIARLKSKGEDS